MSGGNYDRSKKQSILNPAIGYAFSLMVEAAFMLPCRSVRVFTKENDFDYYQEGGLNDYVHMLRKPISKPFTFQVERYVGVSASADFNMGFLDPLTLGTDLILPVILFVNRSPAPDWGDNISFTNCARAYIFTGCTVTAKEFGELNAEQSRLLTETTTIAYRELFTINQISPSWEKGEVWKFKDGDYLGEGESHPENRMVQKPEDNKWKKSEIKVDATNPEANKDKRANLGLWTLNSNDPYTGSGVAHDLNKSNREHTTPDGTSIAAKDLPKDDMIDPAKNPRAGLWTYNVNDPYTGSGVSHDINKNNVGHKDDKGKEVPATDMPKKDMTDPEKNKYAGLWTYNKNDPYTGSGVSHDINKNNVGHKDEQGKDVPARDMSKADMMNNGKNHRAGVWTLKEKDPYTGSGIPHNMNKNNVNHIGPNGEMIGAKDLSKADMVDPSKNPRASKWEWKKDDPYTGSGDEHKLNRNVKEKPAPSKWTLKKDDPYTGSGDEHKLNRNVKKKPVPSKWTLNKDDPYTGSGDEHKLNRNVKEKPAPSKWEYNKGDPYTGSGDEHKLNRSVDTKAEPSIWPPTRRALMAKELSK